MHGLYHETNVKDWSPVVGATRWGSSLGSTGGMGPQRVFFEALYPAVKKIPNSSVTSALVSGSSANLFPSFSPSVLSPRPVPSLSGSSVLLTPPYNLLPAIVYSQGLWEDTQLADGRWNSPSPVMLWWGWLFRHCPSLVGHLAPLPLLPCQSPAAGVGFNRSVWLCSDCLRIVEYLFNHVKMCCICLIM